MVLAILGFSSPSTILVYSGKTPQKIVASLPLRQLVINPNHRALCAFILRNVPLPTKIIVNFDPVITSLKVNLAQ